MRGQVAFIGHDVRHTAIEPMQLEKNEIQPYALKENGEAA
jgi:hypothetical protein